MTTSPPLDQGEIMDSMTLPTWREIFPNHDRELEECHREREKFYATLEGSDL